MTAHLPSNEELKDERVAEPDARRAQIDEDGPGRIHRGLALKQSARED
ncbi:hypothetical protein Vi05172_g4218 [Venturia inaequalis]|nr:hypothetical protein Vi05172_g4218 [Venturia inaequalis]